MTFISDRTDALRFQFRLRALAQVQPWGTDPPTLHWFNLTDGWYWIEVAGRQLLRYSDETMHRWETDGYVGLPYVDYYVVRLWEDLLRMLPDVLEPVPEDLQPFIAADRSGWPLPDDDDEDGDFTAQIWYDDHCLDLGYLRNAPYIRWWRTRRDRNDTVTIDWRNRDADADTAIAFAGPCEGRVTVPTQDFIDAVRGLDRDLMAAMAERICEFEGNGTPPGIALDLPSLRKEHRDRASWLAAALGRPTGTDWDAVRLAAARLQGNQPG